MKNYMERKFIICEEELYGKEVELFMKKNYMERKFTETTDYLENNLINCEKKL